MMNAIEIARRMAELGSAQDARNAYTLAIQEGGLAPAEELEAALYILRAEGDYKVAYTCFRSLYDRGLFRADCLDIMTQAFYQPNVKLLKSRYEKNCRALSKYPYLFRKDFIDFEFLPIRFYPFDDDGYLPFHPAEERFDDYVNFNRAVVSRNFFHDLENPILAQDVYSQYELEYLNDNVRPSEWVGRENHIYLHYTDWGEFCAHLQVLNVRSLLKSRKIVFLIGDEIGQYPIDFKERFDIDYSQYPVKPIGIRELKRLIWHTQLSTHNGGDFFNEIFDGHPNLLCMPSILFSRVEEDVSICKAAMEMSQSVEEVKARFAQWDLNIVQELYALNGRTDTDYLNAIFLNEVTHVRITEDSTPIDPAERIVPAIFFQPHFKNVGYEYDIDPSNCVTMYSEEYESLRGSPLMRGYTYIKTFTPMRCITTSYGASLRFAYQSTLENEHQFLNDTISRRILNRSYMVDPYDRFYTDSVLVRFEDGKLNPKATFTALAAFLDLPYTKSMTYCSLFGKINPESLKGNDVGFSDAAIYRTYDDYANDAERYFIEYFMRDAYEAYGYRFRYYDGGPVDEARAKELIGGFTTINSYIRKVWEKNVAGSLPDDGSEDPGKDHLEEFLRLIDDNRLENAKLLLRGLRFVNKNGQPLQMMPKLELDPALLEQPLYH